jgi:Uma2 family endonuclease
VAGLKAATTKVRLKPDPTDEQVPQKHVRTSTPADADFPTMLNGRKLAPPRRDNMAHMNVVQPRVSYADLERAPDDGRQYELYDGEVFVVPTPLPRHQVAKHLIVRRLYGYASAHGGFAVHSPIDIVFSEYDVLQPDVVFFNAERRHLIDLDAPIRHAPDLCVEVISPSTENTDRGRKMQMFARYGVPEYWIADARTATIEIYRLEGSTYTLAVTGSGDEVVESPSLHGLAFRVASIFAFP